MRLSWAGGTFVNREDDLVVGALNISRCRNRPLVGVGQSIMTMVAADWRIYTTPRPIRIAPSVSLRKKNTKPARLEAEVEMTS